MIRQGFIPSIFNYCDQWCSRCSKSTQCRFFANEQEQHLVDVEQNIKSEELYIKIAENLSDAIGILEDLSSKFGINLNDLLPGPPPTLPESHNDLINQATIYGMEVNQWLNEFQNYVIHTFELTGDNGKLSFPVVIEAVDVIRWYSILIGAKISGASYRLDEEDEYNMTGSAKVALIGLDRSMDAFTKILTEMPQYEDSILVFLAKLAIIKQEVNQLFPDADSFKRPAFD
ncbi:MAG: hypothetical protein D4R67_06860 [Bacteroidetes bacterium]|nr:MAG: hypothetical protein D4R67_06860 [Bacteroidota bacterium]